MNIETAQNIQKSTQTTKTQANTSSQKSDVKFADELKNMKQEEKADKATKEKNVKTTEQDKKNSVDETNKENDEATEVKELNEISEKEEQKVDTAINTLSIAVQEINKLSHSEDTAENEFKTIQINDDIKFEDNEIDMIDNNDMNIRERELINPQMNASMSFNSSGQPFSDFMNQDSKEELSSSTKDIAEEKAIMSTMSENYMIAKAKSNAANIQNTRTNIPAQSEKAEAIIMSRADVDFFASLVDNKELNMSEVTKVEKSSKVSKTLADMLADSMKNNKPVRIDFDNDISVIIKISRNGKISADFLPSSQIAEAYLRDNLPILRQKFDENNIDYDELNQRKQKQNQDKDNKKKDGKDE